MNPLSIGKSIFVCLIKIINYLGYEKMIFILCIPTALLSACSPSGMQGNPAAVQAGAAIGGVLGAIVGDRAGGYNGSQFGALLGTVTGAAVGNAITTPREETGVLRKDLSFFFAV